MNRHIKKALVFCIIAAVASVLDFNAAQARDYMFKPVSFLPHQAPSWQ